MRDILTYKQNTLAHGGIAVQFAAILIYGLGAVQYAACSEVLNGVEYAVITTDSSGLSIINGCAGLVPPMMPVVIDSNQKINDVKALSFYEKVSLGSKSRC